MQNKIIEKLNNISITYKGALAFGFLALLAMLTCAFIFVRSQSAISELEQANNLVRVSAQTALLRSQMNEADFALKSFLLTGDRKNVEVFETSVASFDFTASRLEAELSANYPEDLPRLKAAVQAAQNWRENVANKQIELMRDPMTVDLARAMETAGKAKHDLAEFKRNIDVISGDLDELTSASSAEVEHVLGSVATMTLAVAGITVLAATILGVLNHFLFCVPLARLTKATEQLAAGDLEVEIPSDREDELGHMAQAMGVFRTAAISNRQYEAEAEENRKNLEAERVAAQEKADAEASERLRIATAGLAAGLKQLAAGNLSVRLEERFAPEFEGLRADFNQSVGQLASALGAISDGIMEVERSMREIAGASNDLSRRTESQAASLEQTAAAVEEITANVAHAAQRTGEAKALAGRATQSAAHSAQIVAEAEQAIQAIQDGSTRIANIIGVIDDIAFQTNLLALNAGVEAARAGEAGKGFAVVAQEVRELAQRSAGAAKEIRDLIGKSTANVSSGVGLVRDTGEALRTINGVILEMDTHIDAINSSATEQATGLKEVNQSVSSMDLITQQNAAMVEQANAATAGAAAEAERLRGLIADFDLKAAKSPDTNDLRQIARSMAS